MIRKLLQSIYSELQMPNQLVTIMRRLGRSMRREEELLIAIKSERQQFVLKLFKNKYFKLNCLLLEIPHDYHIVTYYNSSYKL